MANFGAGNHFDSSPTHPEPEGVFKILATPDLHTLVISTALVKIVSLDRVRAPYHCGARYWVSNLPFVVQDMFGDNFVKILHIPIEGAVVVRGHPLVVHVFPVDGVDIGDDNHLAIFHNTS